jgi:multidrug transporter EmrE-like cation transporter
MKSTILYAAVVLSFAAAAVAIREAPIAAGLATLAGIAAAGAILVGRHD